MQHCVLLLVKEVFRIELLSYWVFRLIYSYWQFCQHSVCFIAFYRFFWRCESDDGSTTLATLKGPSVMSTHTHKPSGHRILPRLSSRAPLRHNLPAQNSLRGTRLLVIIPDLQCYKPDDTKQYPVLLVSGRYSYQTKTLVLGVLLRFLAFFFLYPCSWYLLKKLKNCFI